MSVHPGERHLIYGVLSALAGSCDTDCLIVSGVGVPSGGTLLNGQVMDANQTAIYLRQDGTTAATTVYYTVNGGTAWASLAAAGITDFGAGGILTDLIVESTLGAGVTIEGLKIEDQDIDTSAATVTWTHATTGAGQDLELTLTGAQNASIILTSSGTGADAIKLNATAGGLDVDSAGGATVTVTGAVEVDATGAISVESSAGAISVGADGVAQAVNIGTGGARPIAIGSAATASLLLEAGVGGIDMNADTTIDIDTAGAVTIDSSGGAISVGADAVAQALNLGTGGARAIAVGSAAAASLLLEAGVGALTVRADTTADIDSGTAMSFNSSGGAINVGNDNVAQALNLGTAGARDISIGSAAAASLLLEAGVGGVDMNADTTIDIDAAGAVTIDSSAGAISVGADAVAQAVNLATGAAARVITIGNAASASLDLDAGVGALTAQADTALSLTGGASSTWQLSGNAAGAITLTVDVVNAGAGNGLLVLTADQDIAVGDAVGNPTTTLTGTGNIIVAGATKRLVDAGAAELLLCDDDVLIIADPADSTKRARLDAVAVTAGQTRVISIADRNQNLARMDAVITADPGTGVAIPVTDSATVVFTIAAGVETNTLAAPVWRGQTMALYADTVGGGSRAVTSAVSINQAANTVMTFAAARDFIKLEGIYTGGGLVWQVTANDGVALS